MLSKHALEQAISRGLLHIQPFHIEQLDTAHIDLHLSKNTGKELTIAAKGFVVTQTEEKITLANSLCALVGGRTKLAQLGISVEQSSTFVEPGSNNYLRLEIFNASDKTVKLKAGDKIAKMFVLKVIDEL